MVVSRGAAELGPKSQHVRESQGGQKERLKVQEYSFGCGKGKTLVVNDSNWLGSGRDEEAYSLRATKEDSGRGNRSRGLVEEKKGRKTNAVNSTNEREVREQTADYKERRDTSNSV